MPLMRHTHDAFEANAPNAEPAGSGTPIDAISTARPPARRELLLIAVGYLAYALSRLLAADGIDTARANARSIANLEHSLGIDLEVWLNSAFTSSVTVEIVSSYWYSVMHYLVTPLVLFALYRRRPELYRPLRTSLVLATLAALAIYIAWPTAPPRLTDDFHDTLLITADYGWWSGHASAPDGLGSTTNELAAMPSMHVGWALWSSIAMLALVRARWIRALVMTYPAITVVVVVGTANHWILDAVIGAVITTAAVICTTFRHR